MTMRVGQGYDLHRLVSGKLLWIGGVQIDSPVGSEAHSDGDVLLHALIDALLGAWAEGDIGDHFPPSNPEFKDIASSKMLTHALSLLEDKPGKLQNIDATIFLEAPKLYPYKQTIRLNLARLLKLPEDAVSVKAKTAEKFAPIGTGDAIAASVTVLFS